VKQIEVFVTLFHKVLFLLTANKVFQYFSRFHGLSKGQGTANSWESRFHNLLWLNYLILSVKYSQGSHPFLFINLDLKLVKHVHLVPPNFKNREDILERRN